MRMRMLMLDILGIKLEMLCDQPVKASIRLKIIWHDYTRMLAPAIEHWERRRGQDTNFFYSKI